nr:hypothetical protein [Escherichia coli]
MPYFSTENTDCRWWLYLHLTLSVGNTKFRCHTAMKSGCHKSLHTRIQSFGLKLPVQQGAGETDKNRM